MTQPLLAQISFEAFYAIPQKAVPRTLRLEDPNLESDRAAEWIVTGFIERLIFKNQPILEMLGDAERRKDATVGQRVLYCLSVFDGQVKNGGITQFFWNCPDLVFDVSDALHSLNVPELTQAYDRAVESLVGKKDKWFELRDQAYKDANHPDWEPFRQSYDLLNLEGFEEAYYDKHDPSDYSRIVKPGLSSILMRQLRDYVVAHPEEFIAP
jgi:hypothetical protein